MSDTVTEEQADEVVQEIVDESIENKDSQEMQGEIGESETDQQKEEETVPLSALKKVRKEAQEAKMRAEVLDQQIKQYQSGYNQNESQSVDNSDDLLTVGQQQKALDEWKRSILEESFLENNPGVVERVQEELPEILSDPKNKWLADSLNQAPNRLQRAVQILDMFKPKKQAAPAPDRKNTPKSPQSVAKTNKLSTADRIMEMSDDELEQWRVSQKRKVR